MLAPLNAPAGPVSTWARRPLDAHPRRPVVPPPRLGEHTAEVLDELGDDAAAIARLKERHVVDPGTADVGVLLRKFP